MSEFLDETVPQKPEHLYEMVFSVAQTIDVEPSTVFLSGVREPQYSQSAETIIKVQESRRRTHTDPDGDSYSQFEEAISFATVTVQPLGSESRLRIRLLDSKPSGGFESFLDDQPKHVGGTDIQVWTENDFDRWLFLLEFAYHIMYESAGKQPASDWLREAIDARTTGDTNILRGTTAAQSQEVLNVIVDYLNQSEDKWKSLVGNKTTLNLESGYRRFSIFPVPTSRKLKQVEGANRVDLIGKVEYLMLVDEVAVLMEVLDERWRDLLKALSSHLAKTIGLKRILSKPPLIDMGSGYSAWEVESMRRQTSPAENAILPLTANDENFIFDGSVKDFAVRWGTFLTGHSRGSGDTLGGLTIKTVQERDKLTLSMSGFGNTSALVEATSFPKGRTEVIVESASDQWKQFWSLWRAFVGRLEDLKLIAEMMPASDEARAINNDSIPKKADQSKPPRLPKGESRAKWRRVWSRVKPMRTRGDDAKTIRKWLDSMSNNNDKAKAEVWVPNIDTLRDLLRAGDAGLLE